MGLNLNDKKAVVAEVSAQVANAQTIVIAEYRGIEVTDLTVLRRKARESGVYLRVLKNTLVRRAVAGTEFAGLADQMVGPLIYSVSADPVAAAKVLNDFAKTNDKLVLKAGSYAGKVLDKAGVQALASVPSREELLSKLLYVMQAPVAGFVRGLQEAVQAWQKQTTEALGTVASTTAFGDPTWSNLFKPWEQLLPTGSTGQTASGKPATKGSR